MSQTDKYISVPQLKNYSDAQSFCRSEYGADLASIHSDEDNNAIKELCSANEGYNCLIGLNDIEQENVFEWEDGSAFDYGSDVSGGKYPWGAWSDGQPNNYGQGEHCVVLFAGGDYNWGDIGCADDEHNFFICNANANTATVSVEPTLSESSQVQTTIENASAESKNPTSTWLTIFGSLTAAVCVVACCGCGFNYRRKKAALVRYQSGTVEMNEVEPADKPDGEGAQAQYPGKQEMDVLSDNDNQVLSAETIIVDPNTIPEHEHAHRPKLSERKIENKADLDDGNDVKFPVSQYELWASNPKEMNLFGDDQDELMYDPSLKVESERTLQGLQPDGDDDVKLDVAQYEAWTSDEVVRWIVSLNYEAHKQYEVRLRAAFVADIVNGRALIGISDEYLKECGVSIVHRQTILQLIQKMIRLHGAELEVHPGDGGEGELNLQGGEAEGHTNNIDPELGAYEAMHTVDL